MGYYGAFVHGSNTFTINGDLKLSPDWVPPGASVTAAMSSGTMANRMGGGKVTSKRYNDRLLDVPIYSKGASQAETHVNVRQLMSFIERCLEDEGDKLFFVFGASDAVPYTPKWGQMFQKYEVKHTDGAQITGGSYLNADVRNKWFPWSIQLTVAPFSTGERQLVGSATGGILEHTWGTADGSSRGLVVPEATTNLVKNPIFGHSTWNTAWTDGAQLTDVENTDKNYILFGNSSAKLTASGSTTNYYLATVTAANTNTHAFSYYVKLPDGGTVSAAQTTCMYAGGGLTETYTSIGDGWYRVTATVSGIASAQTFRINVEDGYTIYVDGCQFEESDAPTPVCYGDLLGCTWTSTIHNSESTRTVARYRLEQDKTISLDMGSVRMVVKMHHSNGTFPATFYLWANSNTGLRGVFTSNDFRLTDNTNNADSSAKTWSGNDVYILHYTWSMENGLNQYVNGSLDGTNATYTQPAAGSYLYLGSSATPNLNAPYTILDFATWQEELTSSEILADANNISEYLNSGDGLGQCLNPIPYLWTDDGDNEVDNCYESGTYEHFCFVGGVPGNVDAITDAVWATDPSTQNDMLEGVLYVNQILLDKYRDPTDFCFTDLNGTGSGDYCGNQYTDTLVATAFATVGNVYVTSDNSRAMRGKPIRGILARMYDANPSSCKVVTRYQLDTSAIVILSEEKSITTTTSNDMYELPALSIPDFKLLNSDENHRFYIGGQIKRTTGSNNIRMDFIHVAYDRLLKISRRYESNSTDTDTYYSSEKHRAIDYTAATSIVESFCQVAGDVIELSPNNLNMVSFLILYNEVNHLVDTPYVPNTEITFYVTPRWSLL